MEEQLNEGAKEGWIFAADAARIADERASSEDQKHTSGGVFVAVDSNLGAVVGGEEGTVTSIPGNEGRIGQVWLNVRGGMRMFAAYLWHTEEWSPRNEACFDEFWSLPILSYRSLLDWTLMSHTHFVMFSNIASVTIPTSCHAMIETSAQVPNSLALRFLFTMSSNIFLAIIISGSSSDFFVCWARRSRRTTRTHMRRGNETLEGQHLLTSC